MNKWKTYKKPKIWIICIDSWKANLLIGFGPDYSRSKLFHCAFYRQAYRREGLWCLNPDTLEINFLLISAATDSDWCCINRFISNTYASDWYNYMIVTTDNCLLWSKSNPIMFMHGTPFISIKLIVLHMLLLNSAFIIFFFLVYSY